MDKPTRWIVPLLAAACVAGLATFGLPMAQRNHQAWAMDAVPADAIAQAPWQPPVGVGWESLFHQVRH